MPADPTAPAAPRARAGRARTAGRAAVVLALVVVVAVLYRYGTPHNFFDLKIYMSAARWWAAGHELYDYVQPDALQGALYFTYPPFAALLLRPFAALPLGVTVTIFTAFTAAAVVVTSWWLVRPVADRHGLPRWWAVGVAVPLVFALESTRETVNFGQINMLLVVLILADLTRAVPGNSRWAGVGIGLATAIKLFPGIFVVYLLLTRRWRATAVAAASAAAATLLAAAVAPGDSWRFWTHELWLTDRVGRPDYTGNQSLLGLLSRLTVPDRPHQLVWLALVAVAAGYGLWRAARAGRAGDDLAGISLTGLVGALISPITWTHHVYWFVPAVIVLVDTALRGRARKPTPGSQENAPGGQENAHGSQETAHGGQEPTRGSQEATPGSQNPAQGGLRDTLRAYRRPAALLTLAGVLCVCLTYGVVSYHDWGITAERTDSLSDFVLRNLYTLLALLLLVVLPVRPPTAVTAGTDSAHNVRPSPI